MKAVNAKAPTKSASKRAPAKKAATKKVAAKKVTTRAAKPVAVVLAPTTRKWATGPKQHHSAIDAPCAFVHEAYWNALDAANGDKSKVSRKAVIEFCVAEGVDIFTAKTQYQKVFSGRKERKTEDEDAE